MNKVKRYEYQKKWVKKNPEKIKEYYQKNREKMITKAKVFAEKYKGKNGKLTREEIYKLNPLMRRCCRCGKTYPSLNFYISRSCTTGLSRVCKSCDRGESATRKYGISLKEREAMFGKQNGKCAICGELENGRKLAIDHDHKTETLRGLLCDKCNKMLGFSKENIGILESAVKYLTYYRNVT